MRPSPPPREAGVVKGSLQVAVRATRPAGAVENVVNEAARFSCGKSDEGEDRLIGVIKARPGEIGLFGAEPGVTGFC